MEFTTTLRSEVNEANFKWNIVNYCEYEDCGIEKLSTPPIPIKSTNATAMLTIYPKRDSADLELEVEGPDDTEKHLFSSNILVELEGNKFNSPCNRNSVRCKGFYADPIEVKPAQWKIVAEKIIDKNFKARTKFIDSFHPEYLTSGTLTLDCRFSIKTVKVFNEFKHL